MAQTYYGLDFVTHLFNIAAVRLLLYVYRNAYLYVVELRDTNYQHFF